MSSTHLRTKSCFVALVLALLLAQSGPAFSQKAYFVDGYHGGVYGHYPPWVTGFLVEKLRQNPDWRICLEIEPVTWDTVRADTPEAYKEFKAMATDPATRDRIEFVNPAYGQSYCYNIPGEMLIRQFTVGQRKLREHFPDFKPLTYCSEEPCFTSALPGILRSLGFKYAVLKNPGTCFGGYTRAFGGELVNWMGPDGTTIPTVPRYESEGLARDNTWQTMAWRNVPPYIHAALKQGIAHPVGMCLQDAGWRQGPFLTDFYGVYKPTQYVTWREYFENVAVKTPDRDWRMSQEDVQVTLVWGAQVLQRIAQQCRRAENTILSTEKLAAMAKLVAAAPWPEASFNKAWPTLLLAQHHDCWIVPNNARRGDSWADKVGRWTGSTREICANVAKQSLAALAPSGTSGDAWRIRVFNTLGVQRRELVEIPLPAEIAATPLAVRDGDGREVPSQIVASRKEGASPALLLCASVPPLGYSTYRLDRAAPAAVSGARATLGPDDVCTLETDRYSVVLNGRCGGTIRSLMSKLPQPRQWVDASSPRKFGEIRGFFRDERAFRGNAEQPARFEILENGPMRVRVLVRGRIGEHPIAQEITLVQGQDRVDFNLELAWQGNPSIGEEYARKSGPRREDRHKAFYDDRYKLQVLFPSTLKSPKIFKNAPFDVTESRLRNTFFNTWDDIKNNVILNWVDAHDAAADRGLGLLTDHTTSYVHGPDYPLGLTLQYSGAGIWQGYRIDGASRVRYALLPHSGNWRQTQLWTASDQWNEPLVASVIRGEAGSASGRQSLLDLAGTGWELVSAVFQGNDLVVRVFNAEGGDAPAKFSFAFAADKVRATELNGSVIGDLAVRQHSDGRRIVTAAIPKFGVKTYHFTNARLDSHSR